VWEICRVRGVGQRPGLDGVRALAIAAVVLYHAQVTAAAGGFLGVDIFFVLSGFLITSILLDERARHGTVQVGRFWLRRARRLLPAAFLVVFVSMVVVAVWHPDALRTLRGDALASVFYVNNWHQVFAHHSYFDSFQRPSLLRHYWSLAVEEQFYLVWPLALLAMRRWPRRRIGAVALVGASASALLMALLFNPGADPSRIYYGTDTRAMPILVGVALACFWPVMTEVRDIGRGALRLLDLGGLLGLGVLVYAIVSWTGFGSFVYRGGLVVVAAGTALLLGAAAHPASQLARLLGARPLVWIGRRSYGIYLWHWPVMALSRPAIDVQWSLWLLVPVQVAITVALSALSYRFVEMPIRAGVAQRRIAALFASLRPTGRRIVMGGVATAAVATVFVLAVLPTPTAPAPLRRLASSDALVPAAHIQPPTKHVRVVSNGIAPRRPVLMVGASVMLAAIRPLHELLHASVDAKVSRQPVEILHRIEAYRHRHALRPVVAVQIGENGPFTSWDAHLLRRALRGVPRVILINLRYPGERWVTDANRRLAHLAKVWPQATVANWHQASANPKLLWDGTHPDPTGALVYARTVRSAIDG
jgi:peptidoglycan/LPS O-acetylase OafA/YrhL